MEKITKIKIGSKEDQEDADSPQSYDSEKERMQLVRGQVAMILENYYEDTLVAPSGDAMAGLVDKTSLKSSQITSWYYRRKRKGAPSCADNSLSDSEKGSENSKREGHAGPSKRAKFPASTVSKVEELFTKLNGVLPAQKELDAFSAELNLSGSQVYAWWYRHKARLEKTGKEQHEIHSRVTLHSELSKHSPIPSVGMAGAWVSGLGFRNNNNISNSNDISEISAHAQAQRLAAALMLRRVDKHTLQMHHILAHAHPSQLPGGVSVPTPLDATTLRMLHAAAGPLSLFNYSTTNNLGASRHDPALVALDLNASPQQTAPLKVTASVAQQHQQQVSQSVSLGGFDHSSVSSALLRTLQPNTPKIFENPVFGNANANASSASNPADSDNTGVNNSSNNSNGEPPEPAAVGTFMIHANPATKQMAIALALANRPMANPPGTPFGFAKVREGPESPAGSAMSNNHPPSGIVKPVCCAAKGALLSAFMGTPPDGSSPAASALSQQWLANMLAANLTNLASLPDAIGTHQVSHQPPSHLHPQYQPPPRISMPAGVYQMLPSASGHHQLPVDSDNAATTTQTILALQFALQSTKAARDEELRCPTGGQSAFNGNFDDDGCYSWLPPGSSSPYFPNSRS